MTMKMLGLLSAACLVPTSLHAQAPTAVKLNSPRPYQIVQRQGFVPQRAHDHEAGGPVMGFADVVVRAQLPQVPELLVEYQVVTLREAFGKGTDWATLSGKFTGANYEGVARVPAGGWYRLEVRCRAHELIVAKGSVEPFGVGEVFVIAGQSYATNCNDEPLKVADAAGRIAAYDAAAGKWRVAHDPQPSPDGSDGGSIWPAFGDLLLPLARVPIGFVNVAVGGTASDQWLPDGKLHTRLVEAGKTLGRFRAVLWQQGESDVIGKVTTESYVKNLQSIRAAASKAWGFEPPWLLAKSTLHPTVYHLPEGEGRIRRAIDELVKAPGFLPGPDTDILAGDNRGGMNTRRHFTGLGQRRAAAMWFASVWRELSVPRPDHETVLSMLPDLHLLEPMWSSPLVYRESSTLLQLKPDGCVTARLAFPAREIIEIATASRQHRYTLGKDVKLDGDGQTLIFMNPKPITPIHASEFFPKTGAPNSYRHRVGHPEQNLLYGPGRWFHDRQVEVTYRKRDASWPAAVPAHAEKFLPKTCARLRKGRPLTLGISGDSISTGLDASALSRAAPHQPGYPDLVAAQLQTSFRSEVTLRNRAVSGWSVTHGLQDLEKLLACKPHLIVVAYGMNDVGRRDPEWFGKQTRALLDRIRRADPDAEVILVAPMLGHSEWIHTPRDMFPKYRDALQALTGPGVALADVTSIWEVLLRSKHDLDLTGNGLNHPNDFGHRLYAQAILALLVRAPDRKIRELDDESSSRP